MSDKTTAPEKLLPCPFCGKKPVHNTSVIPGLHQIACDAASCKIKPETKWLMSKDKAVSLWNVRT